MVRADFLEELIFPLDYVFKSFVNGDLCKRLLFLTGSFEGTSTPEGIEQNSNWPMNVPPERSKYYRGSRI